MAETAAAGAGPLPLVRMARAGDVMGLYRYLGEFPAAGPVPDIDAVDEDGFSALMCVAYQGEWTLVQKLVEMGADKFVACAAKGKEGWTAYEFAYSAQDKLAAQGKQITLNFPRIIRYLCPPDVEEELWEADIQKQAEELGGWKLEMQAAKLRAMQKGVASGEWTGGSVNQ